MKKILFLSAIALGLMTSCSSDDDMLTNASASSIDANSIVFSTGDYSPVSTRAGVTITSLNKFTVDAVTADKKNYFSSVDFTFNGAKSEFESATPYYWPTDGSLSFYAISDPGSKTVNADAVPSYTYTDWAGEKDLVASSAIAGQKMAPFHLGFYHATSQIRVTAEAADKSQALTYKLSSVRLTTPATGTLAFSNINGEKASWSIVNNKTKNYSYDSALPISFTNTGKANPSTVYWNILPVKDGTMTFEIEYQVIQNGRVIADFTGEDKKVCEVKAPNLEMGKKYNYNFKLPVDASSTVITFTTTVYSWQNGTDSNIDVPSTPTMQEVRELLAEQGDYISGGEINWNNLLSAKHVSWPNSMWSTDAMYVFQGNNIPEKKIKDLMSGYEACLAAAAEGDMWPWSPSDYMAVINNAKFAANVIWETLPASEQTYAMHKFLGLDL